MRGLVVLIFFLKYISQIVQGGTLYLAVIHLPKKISAFVDHQLKPLDPQISSHVTDTNDFLKKKLKDMDRFPDGALLVTIDVVGLYPHIPHKEGLEALRKILNTRTN